MSAATGLGGNNTMKNLNTAAYFYFSYYYFFADKK